MRSSVLLVLLLLPAVSALTPLDAGTMEATVAITNTVRFTPAQGALDINDARATLTWFPRNTWLQEATITSVVPQASRSDDAISFSWEPPGADEALSVHATVRTRNAIVPVRQRIPFPLSDVPPELTYYLEPGEITDLTPEIAALARELAQGRTDAYDVVFALADWTTSNVNYSLASLGQPASQRSSQVLASRYGKCDELTSLFISMNRAVGIPARFVAGYAYSNNDPANPWGGHGWAEVWLPGQGWVPYDVTYGEYGYLDAGHVALSVSPDAKESSITYAARGGNFDLRTQPLDITVTPTSLAPRAASPVSITLSSPYTTVGFGSTVLLLATVENERDYYVSTRLDLGQTASTRALRASSVNVLLSPRETAVVPFLVTIDQLTPGKGYVFPFGVSTRLGGEATISIRVLEHAPYYDERAYDAQLAAYERGVVPPPFTVTCEQGRAYVGGEITHACTISKNVDIVQVCEKACVPVAVRGGTFTLTTTVERPGITTVGYDAVINGQRVTFYVPSRGIELPVLHAALGAPVSTTPRESIVALLQVNATGNVRDVDATLRVHHADATERLDSLRRPAEIAFSVPGRALRPGVNTLVVHVAGADELGTPVSTTAKTTIMLVDVTFVDRVEFWLEDAAAWLGDLAG